MSLRVRILIFLAALFALAAIKLDSLLAMSIAIAVYLLVVWPAIDR
jgi:hypothetical protein